MAHGDDRVGVRDRVVRQPHPSHVLRAGRSDSGELENCRGRVGRDDAVSGVEEVPGEQPTPAAELDDQTSSVTHGPEQRHDARRAHVGVEPEAAVVHQREVVAVIRLIVAVHAGLLSSRRRAGPRR